MAGLFRLADYARHVPVEIAHLVAAPGLAVLDADHAGVVGDRSGEWIEALRDPVGRGGDEFADIGRPLASKNVDALNPSPRRTMAGLNVPAITALAVCVMNGPQVKPSPVSQPFGASCRASTDWKPIE